MYGCDVFPVHIAVSQKGKKILRKRGNDRKEIA